MLSKYSCRVFENFCDFVYVIDDVIAIVLGPENGEKVPPLIEHEGNMV